MIPVKCDMCKQEHIKVRGTPLAGQYNVWLCPNMSGGCIIKPDIWKREWFVKGQVPANPYTGIDAILAKGFNETIDNPSQV